MRRPVVTSAAVVAEQIRRALSSIVIPICNQSDVLAIRSAERALLFLWVEWAIHARWSQRVVNDAVAALDSLQPGRSVSCYIADVSSQEGELWEALGAWLTKEKKLVNGAGHTMRSGSGPLLCVQAGHIVHCVNVPFRFSATEIAVACRDAFGDHLGSKSGPKD